MIVIRWHSMKFHIAQKENDEKKHINHSQIKKSKYIYICFKVNAMQYI